MVLQLNSHIPLFLPLPKSCDFWRCRMRFHLGHVYSNEQLSKETGRESQYLSEELLCRLCESGKATEGDVSINNDL